MKHKPRFGDVFRWDNKPHNYLVMYVAPDDGQGWLGIQLTLDRTGYPVATYKVSPFLDFRATGFNPGPGWIYVESLCAST